MSKINIAVSSCLLGEPVRYDGGHKHDHYITETLGCYFERVLSYRRWKTWEGVGAC